MKIKVLCILILTTLLAQAGEIVHFTPQESGFVTELIIRNASQNKANFVLEARNAHAKAEDNRFSLDAGQTLVLAGKDFSSWPSNLSYETSDLLHVSVRYSLVSGANSVTQPGIEDLARVYRYGYLDQEDFWQGLALVSPGERDTRVVVRQVDVQGVQLGEDMVLAEALPPNEKLLVVVSNLSLVKDKGSYLEVEATNPVSAVMLFGNDPDSSAPIMSLQQPEKVYKNHISVGYSGGFAGWSAWVEMTESKVTLGSSETSRDESSYEVNYTALRDELITLGATVLQVDAMENPCCDHFDYYLEIVDGSRRNRIAFSSFDSDENDSAAKALAMIKKVFENAFSLTDSTVPLPF